ncbi:hypothetical protein GQ43DRAFT_67537 [Delitschia confertaspora ATCC 74209]|uniref:Uncharacterized protein n=1 Tax=Delitschia confertaspora ATCC 74209 TaxID=1513339 RepID=A0A9P4MVW0_9PLEO|nr:hypothetical protein GQ43DRAFT_67537 [Delitschia confertaspora ATCC 74209]
MSTSMVASFSLSVRARFLSSWRHIRCLWYSQVYCSTKGGDCTCLGSSSAHARCFGERLRTNFGKARDMCMQAVSQITSAACPRRRQRTYCKPIQTHLEDAVSFH